MMRRDHGMHGEHGKALEKVQSGIVRELPVLRGMAG